MNQSIIAFVGISGIGKSTLLNSLAPRLMFQHLQASQLIKESIKAQNNELVLVDDLRRVDINDNQALLIEGFKKTKDEKIPLIVLDGHTVIDTPSGITVIDPDVFRKIGVTSLIFLSDAPEQIHARRLNDKLRNRPDRTLEQLKEYQEIALLSAFRVSLSLQVPLSVFSIELVNEIYAALLNAS